MQTTSDAATGRTEHLLTSCKRATTRFNARDFATVDTVHDRNMVAHVTGNYGSVAHAAHAADLANVPRHASEHALSDSIRKR
jgi:hypothetical protein